jgi:hypothetical protein
MVPSWIVVDKLVHELGSLRAVVQEVEAQPDLADHDVTVELRACVARAADTIHLVIGGNDGMVSQAWRCIAEAQELGGRVHRAVDRSRATPHGARAIREGARAKVQRGTRPSDEPKGLRLTNEPRRLPKREPRAKA